MSKYVIWCCLSSKDVIWCWLLSILMISSFTFFTFLNIRCKLLNNSLIGGLCCYFILFGNGLSYLLVYLFVWLHLRLVEGPSPLKRKRKNHSKLLDTRFITFIMGLFNSFGVHMQWMRMLVRAACVRCHGTKCPLLTAFFLLSAGLLFSQKGLS